MDKKNKAGAIAAIAGCGAAAAFGILLCIIFAVSQRVPSIQASAKEAKSTQTEETYDFEQEKETVYADFSIGKEAAQTSAEDESGQEPEDSGEYLCSFSNMRLLTEEDISALLAGSYENLPAQKGILRMVINEIYARHGYKFGNEEIGAYFAGKEWYQDVEIQEDASADDILNQMSEIERANIDFISMWENR